MGLSHLVTFYILLLMSGEDQKRRKDYNFFVAKLRGQKHQSLLMISRGSSLSVSGLMMMVLRMDSSLTPADDDYDDEEENDDPDVDDRDGYGGGWWTVRRLRGRERERLESLR